MNPAASRPVPTRAIYPLAVGFVLLLLPQLSRLPVWLSIVALLGCAWGLGQQRQWWRPLPRLVRYGVMLGLVAAFALTHMGSFTVNTAAAFFVLTVALKWTELQRARDVVVLFMILCYLAAVTFLFEQGLFWSLAVIASVLVMFGSLQALSAGGATFGGARAWKRLGWTLLKVIPVVVVLFLVFPRLGPLWSVPLVAERGSAGLSESMTPGQFADLGRNTEPAFRVTFGGAVPAPSKRYWRGLILDRFDGTTWHRSDDASGRRVGRVNRSMGAGALTDGEYEVLMEPSFQPWAFALEASVPATPNVSLTEHGLVQFDRPIDTTVRYRMRHTGAPTMAEMDPELRQRYTALPIGINPQTRAWARELAEQSGSERAFVERLMAHFRQAPFYYTLQPPLLGDNSVDEFLFQTRQGYCAHYAGAAVFALRSVGLPARVVAGYLGGEFGLDDAYLIVRQYDAHAWVEVWLTGQGWVRLDPTAMVAPERVEQNWRQALGQGDSVSAGDWAGQGGYGDSQLLRWGTLRLDALNYYWQRFVVDYQSDTQRSLFGKFPGNPDLATLGMWTAGFVAFTVAVAGLLLVRRERRVSANPIVRRALRWQKWLQRRGVQTGIGQTPLQQAGAAAGVHPESRAVLMAFGRALQSALYNPDATAPDATATVADIDRRWRAVKRIPRRRRTGR